MVVESYSKLNPGDIIYYDITRKKLALKSENEQFEISDKKSISLILPLLISHLNIKQLPHNLFILLRILRFLSLNLFYNDLILYLYLFYVLRYFR